MFAIGTNDAANYAVGSPYGSRARIDILMAAAGDRPVLWLTVKTLRSSGHYANAEMQAWNTALLKACATYPNLRVYDWAAEVKDSWFLDDGIHFGSRGYVERARRTALALAAAFPAASPTSPDCVVTTVS